MDEGRRVVGDKANNGLWQGASFSYKTDLFFIRLILFSTRWSLFLHNKNRHTGAWQRVTGTRPNETGTRRRDSRRLLRQTGIWRRVDHQHDLAISRRGRAIQFPHLFWTLDAVITRLTVRYPVIPRGIKNQTSLSVFTPSSLLYLETPSWVKLGHAFSKASGGQGWFLGGQGYFGWFQRYLGIQGN